MCASNEDQALEQYLYASLDILKAALEQYHQGKTHFYRVAALQLRLLLCDTTRRHGKITHIALVPLVLPDLMLPPVSKHGEAPSGSSLLPLHTWLEQPIQGTENDVISIRQFIRILCDQDGGAHVDPKPNTHLTGIVRREEKIISIGSAFLDGFSRWKQMPEPQPSDH